MIVAGAGFGALLGAPTRYIVTNETTEPTRATAVGLLSQALIVGQIVGSSLAGGIIGLGGERELPAIATPISRSARSRSSRSRSPRRSSRGAKNAARRWTSPQLTMKQPRVRPARAACWPSGLDGPRARVVWRGLTGRFALAIEPLLGIAFMAFITWGIVWRAQHVPADATLIKIAPIFVLGAIAFRRLFRRRCSSRRSRRTLQTFKPDLHRGRLRALSRARRAFGDRRRADTLPRSSPTSASPANGSGSAESRSRTRRSRRWSSFRVYAGIHSDRRKLDGAAPRGRSPAARDRHRRRARRPSYATRNRARPRGDEPGGRSLLRAQRDAQRVRRRARSSRRRLGARDSTDAATIITPMSAMTASIGMSAGMPLL